MPRAMKTHPGMGGLRWEDVPVAAAKTMSRATWDAALTTCDVATLVAAAVVLSFALRR